MLELRFGILGTGNIACQFAEGVVACDRGRIAAVGSRDATRAEVFGRRFKSPHRHGSYDALIGDDSVDAVYISLPNSMHYEWTIKALRAGKHVLCEKPVAANTGQAEKMFDVAREQDRLLVEAFMYRSHPLTHAVLDRVRCGAIGQLKLIRTSFCYGTEQIEGNIRFSVPLAGGSLMDIGCYCVNFARLIAGSEPETIHCTAHLHETGVDDRAAGTLGFAHGVLASFVCGMTVQTNNTALICGDKGWIEVPVPWKPPVENARYLLAGMAPPRQDAPRPPDRPSPPDSRDCPDSPRPTGSSAPALKNAPPPQAFTIDAPKPVFSLEADDFVAAVLDDVAPAVNRDDTLGNMRVLDELRRQAGLGF